MVFVSNMARYNTIQYNTIQYCVVLYCIVLYLTILETKAIFMLYLLNQIHFFSNHSILVLPWLCKIVLNFLSLLSV